MKTTLRIILGIFGLLLCVIFPPILFIVLLFIAIAVIHDICAAFDKQREEATRQIVREELYRCEENAKWKSLGW